MEITHTAYAPPVDQLLTYVCQSPTYSIYCFGDFALKKNHTLEITALSNARIQILLELVSPLKLGIQSC